MEGDKLEFISRPSLGRGYETVPSWAVIGERNFLEEGVGGHGRQPVIGDWQRAASGLLLCVVKSVDEFRDAGIFCPPQIHGGKHGDDFGTLKPTTVSREQVEEIPRGDAGVEGVWVLETPEPSVFDDLEYEGSASHLTGLDERLGGEPGGPFAILFFY